MLRIDCGFEFLRVAGIGEARNWYVGKIGVGEIGRTIRGRPPHGLCDHVHALDVIPPLQRHALQHVERFYDGHTARTRRRGREHFPTVSGTLAISNQVIGVEYFAMFGFVLRQVVERDDATIARYILHENARGFAPVEFGGAILGDALQRGRVGCRRVSPACSILPSFRKMRLLTANRLSRRYSADFLCDSSAGESF